MELWLALRVAYLDRLVGLAVDRLSIRQVVILGAGYDTRAARLPRAGVTFFEVDHPATQAREARAAREARQLSRRRRALRDVQLRARRSDRAARPRTASIGDEPALVIWEGVVPYLTEGAVRATATRLATGLDPRSLVAFDFVGKKFARGQGLNAQGPRRPRDYVGELGEPIRYGSDDILPLLYDCGFRWVRSLDFNELALEMLGDYQRDRMFRFQHLALAAVRTPVAQWP